MRFGKRSGDVPERSGDGDRSYMRYLKQPETRVRFLQECDDWVEFWEHYNPDGFPFPCTNTKDCPGCNHPMERARRASKRYATNALRDGYVEVWKLPSTLRDRLKTRSQRNGGVITDRDYTLIKSGSGLDTEYDYDQHERDKQDLSHHELKDIEELLQQAFREAHPDYDLGQAPPKEQKPKVAAQEPPPFDQGQDREVTVDELKAMKYGELVALLEKEQITGWNEDMTKPELIEWIVEKFSS